MNDVMYNIKMLKLMCGPDGVKQVGKTYVVDETEMSALVKAGTAKLVGEVRVTENEREMTLKEAILAAAIVDEDEDEDEPSVVDHGLDEPSVVDHGLDEPSVVDHGLDDEEEQEDE